MTEVFIAIPDNLHLDFFWHVIKEMCAVLVREKCPNLGASLPPHLGC
jgi:hypothetical protein